MKLYDDIELTPQEQIEAILEGKKKKYFKEKNRAYWEAQERPLNKRRPSNENGLPNTQLYGKAT